MADMTKQERLARAIAISLNLSFDLSPLVRKRCYAASQAHLEELRKIDDKMRIAGISALPAEEVMCLDGGTLRTIAGPLKTRVDVGLVFVGMLDSIEENNG